MLAPLLIGDITSYLHENDWHQQPEQWNGASVWRRDAAEVLVPPRDGMGDGPKRLRDILDCLAEVESRNPADVAHDIANPDVDSTDYLLDVGAGTVRGIEMPAAVHAVQAVQRLLGIAARTVAEGPRTAFRGRPPAGVGRLLAAVRLDVSHDRGFGFTVLTPLVTARPDPLADPPFGRSVLTQVHDAVAAVHGAAQIGDPAAFDDVAMAGASADFCRALSNLAGIDRESAFQLSFRWGRGSRSVLPARTLRFPNGAGAVIREASRRLSGSAAGGTAEVSGLVESLHDQPGGDRWRVRIRGELHTEHGVAQRAVWVRLDGPRSYDEALRAHRERRPVSVNGIRAGGGGLAARPGGLHVLDALSDTSVVPGSAPAPDDDQR